MVKTKKYYRNYYALNKDRINENKRRRREEKKLAEQQEKVNEINNYRNNHDRILVENLRHENPKPLIIQYYEKTINLLTGINWTCLFFIVLILFVSRLHMSFRLRTIFMIIQFLFLIIQIISTIFVVKYERKIIKWILRRE